MRFTKMLRLSIGIAFAFSAAPVLAASPDARSFVGIYSMTTSSAAGVRKTEIRLEKSGAATMKTESSALSMRPVARGAMAPIIERGTWRRSGSRAIMHITSSSNVTVSDPSQAPSFSDVAFSLQGCTLHLEPTSDGTGGGLDFTKRACR